MPLRLNGWLFVLFIQMILISAASVVSLTGNALNSILPNSAATAINPITALFTLAIGVAAIIFIAKKHILAPKMIMAYYLANLAVAILNPVLMDSYVASQLPYTIAMLAVQASVILLVFRYLKI